MGIASSGSVRGGMTVLTVAQVVEQSQVDRLEKHLYRAVGEANLSAARMNGLDRAIGTAIADDSKCFPRFLAQAIEYRRDIELSHPAVISRAHAEAMAAITAAIGRTAGRC